MNFFRKPLIATLIATALLLPTLSAAAQETDQPRPVAFEGHALSYVGGDVWAPGLAGMKQGDQLSLLVHLEGPSVLDVADAIMANRGLATTDGIEGRTMVSLQAETLRRQAPMVAAFERMGATIVSQMQVTLNVVHINIRRDQLAELATMPGVKSISVAPQHELDMNDSRPHIGATRAAEELGFDGTGTVVAIIDTGLDYMHAGLGGHGDVAMRTADDPNIVEDGTLPTEKVLGGYDFVGTAYNGGNQPVPDEDFMDENGHGSHVGGITAGLPSTGTYLGIAPGAKLVGLKVFGAQGSTNVTIEAMDWVASHNLYLGEDNENVPGVRPDEKIDVINMSLGAGYGGGMAEYIAVTDRLIEQGVTVVASAGNSGAAPYIVGSPSATPKILSVANSFAPGEEAMLVTAEWDDQSESYGGTEAAGGWATTLATTGVVTGELAWYGTACDAMPAQEVNEKIALIQRGGCSFYDKVNNAAQQGAIAALVFNNAPGAPIAMGCGAPSPCATVLGIPAVMINIDEGDALRQLLEDGTAVTATMDGSQKIELGYLADVMADSSSRGPGRSQTHIKPQITAPGSNIISVRNGSGTGGVAFSGTSMSGPAVAGVAAILWQRNKDQSLSLSADDIAALAMNYSSPVIKRSSNKTGPLEGVTRQGAGIVDAYKSSMATTLIRSGEGLAELSFGATNAATEPMEYERKFNIYNFGDEAKTYAIDYSFAFPDDDEFAGVSLAFDQEEVTVEAGGTEEVLVFMTVDPDEAREMLAYSDAPFPRDEIAFGVQEVDGYVHVTEVDEAGDPVEGGDMAGVPWHTFPRLRGCTEQDSMEMFWLSNAEDDFETSWSNECNGSTDMELYWHLGSDDMESESEDAPIPAELDLVAAGARYGTAMARTGTEVDAVEIAVTLAGPRTLLINSDTYVFIDADRDGTFDSVIWAVGLQGGQFGAVWAPVAPGELAPSGDTTTWAFGFFVSFDYHQSVLTFTVPLDAFGTDLTLESGDLAFDFGVLIREATGDYTIGDGAVEDLMPNDLKEGGRLSFRQPILDCLSLVGEDGMSLTSAPNTQMPLDSNTSILGTVGYACDTLIGSDEPIDVGILASYINNMPGTDSWSVRPGAIGEPVEPPAPSIYLPWLANGEEEMEPEPTVEPTAEPTTEPLR